MTPGIHAKVPMGAYLAPPYVSASLLHNVLTYSPAHARYWQDHPDEASEASDTGIAIHDALLEGMDRIVPVDATDWRTKAAKEAREAAREAGRIPMLQHKVANVTAAVSAAHRCIAASPLAGIFECGKPEQTICWTEWTAKNPLHRPEDELCKARPDWLTNERDVLLHVKTTKGSANPEVWIRAQLSHMGYDLALAWYARGLAMHAEGDCEHVFLVIEQEPPHGCSLVSLSPAMWDIANGKVDRALALWQRCVASGKYPGYPSAIHYAEPLPWQLAHEEEQRLSQPFTEKEMEGGIPL